MLYKWLLFSILLCKRGGYSRKIQNLVSICKNANVIILLSCYMREGNNSADWILCPVCNNKTRIKIYSDTEILKLPLFCPKCKRETVINVKKGKLEKNNITE